MQKQVSLLVGHYGARENLLNNIQQLQTNTGRRIIQLLSESSCDNEECTLDTFYSADSLIWKSVLLEKGSEGRIGNRVPLLNDFRNNFVPAIISEFTKYFPASEYGDYKVLDPKYWPDDFVTARNFGLQEIKRLSESLMPEMDENVHLACADEWSALLPEMMEKFDTFCSMKRLELLDFWELALSVKKPVVAWQEYPHIHILLARVLCIPIGSSECERGFSIMNHIRTKRRSRLGGDTIDSLMRIRDGSSIIIHKNHLCFNWSYHLCYALT